jgi:tetratricopeptide (TPR) repeat protein
MPLFKRSANPGLDGFTPDEKRKRDALNREVMQTSANSPGRALEDINLEILTRKGREEKSEFLWPFLQGWQLLQMGRLEDALGALENAKNRRPGDSRGAYAVATVYYTASTQARGLSGQWPQGEAYLGMSMADLYGNALQQFGEALALAETGRDRRVIQSSIEVIDRTVALHRMTRGNQEA